MLIVKNLVVKRGYTKAVNRISMNVKKGTVVGLIGLNGAGKTSTLGAIAGIYKSSSGIIEFKENEIQRLPTDKRVEAGIILIPEGRLVFPKMSVLDNLQMGFIHHPEKKYFHKNLNIVFEWFPKLKIRAKQVAGTLSGGEQQMLAIGRGLMRDPYLMMLDEPSLGLAPIVIDEVEKVILKLKEQGMTILLAEQNAGLVFNVCDYIYVLENGKIVLEGKSSEIKSDGIVKSLFMGD